MTNPDHARFADWDAAYVLGALSPAERREFEDHLDDCERCRASVAELSAMPGLLGRIDDARAFALLEEHVDDDETDEPGTAAPPAAEPAAPADLVGRIRTIERRRRLRRTFISVGALAAAAALAVVLTIFIPIALTPGPAAPDAGADLMSVDGGPTPITAFVRLKRVDWGTRVLMDCSYRDLNAGNAGNYSSGVTYSLWVVDTDGSESPVTSWVSTPNNVVRFDTGMATPIEDIDHFDLRNADGSQVLLTGDLQLYDYNT